MLRTPDDLFALFDRLALPTKTVTHRAVFTVAESQDLRGIIPGAHTKNLFLKDKKGRLFLVTTEENATIELKHLHLLIGASGRLSFGSADLLREVLGVEPGSVTVFAAANDTAGRVSVVLDADLMAQPVINGHPLVNTMTTSIAAADLLRFLESVGHVPTVLSVAIPEGAGEGHRD